jgi:uncharacterized protein (DUF1330 family)
MGAPGPSDGCERRAWADINLSMSSDVIGTVWYVDGDEPLQPGPTIGRHNITVTAYWINTFTAINDEQKLARYIELAGPAMREAGGRFLARGNPAHALEGATSLRTTLIEFRSVDEAIAAYHSDGYQAALRVLGDGAEREIRIIDGVRPAELTQPPGGQEEQGQAR